MKALRQYRKYYEAPIEVQVGDKVSWVEKESEWAGWVWCIHPTTKKEGWVPEKCLKKNGSEAEILKSYSAAELNAEPGEEFKVLDEESGWYWCENKMGEQGWLPKELF